VPKIVVNGQFMDNFTIQLIIENVVTFFFETQCICPQVTNLVLVCPKKHQLSSPRKVLRRKLLHHTTFQPTEECFTCLSDSENGSKICSNTAHKSANLYFFHHTNTVRAS